MPAPSRGSNPSAVMWGSTFFPRGSVLGVGQGEASEAARAQNIRVPLNILTVRAMQGQHRPGNQCLLKLCTLSTSLAFTLPSSDLAQFPFF